MAPRSWRRALEYRAPYLPTDFDPRFFNFAPSDLVAHERLHGGEIIDARRVTVDGVPIHFSLPTCELEVIVQVDATKRSSASSVSRCLLESSKSAEDRSERERSSFLRTSL
jgi:hypothetical protein